MNAATITDTSREVFRAYANDAANWSGTPLVGGNVGGSKEERGNLTQLKRAGLVTTFKDDGLVWLGFTAAGVAYAASLGCDVSWAPTALHPANQQAERIAHGTCRECGADQRTPCDRTHPHPDGNRLPWDGAK